MSPAHTRSGVGTVRDGGGHVGRGARSVPGPRRHQDGYEHLEPVLTTYCGTCPGSAERERLRERLVTGYLPVARNIAARYAGRGESVEDLVQVASIGLLHAIERYHPDRGDSFLAFAVPTITGEVRRHFRDKTWSMRVPRRLKESRRLINTSVARLSQELGRAPRPSEIAAHLRLPVEEVLEGLEAAQAYKAASLDALVSVDPGAGEQGRPLSELLGSPDPGFELITDSRAVGPYLAALPERERRLLIMRFYQNMTQTQIADTIGVSQMHVSRLLSGTLARLREAIVTDQPAGHVRGTRESRSSTTPCEPRRSPVVSREVKRCAREGDAGPC